MAHVNKVLRSINLEGETICADIFVRPDGTFGFDEFRRDPEDGRGWYSIGHHSTAVFANLDEAVAQARLTIDWLDAALARTS